MLIRGCGGLLFTVDGLSLGGVWYVPAEPRLERVPTAVSEESRHASCTQSSSRGVIEWIISILVLGIAVDALSLGLSPADAPCGMARRGGNRYNRSHVVFAKEGILQREHTTHRPTNHSGNLLDAYIVQDEFVDSITD